MEAATNSRLKYREVIYVDGWELMFYSAKAADQFPYLS